MLTSLKIQKAIAELGRRVTAADVANRSGEALPAVILQLNELAFQASGRLEVSDEGHVVYAFPPGFQQLLLARRYLGPLRDFAVQLLKVGLYLFRLFFGMALIVSIVVLTIVFWRLMAEFFRALPQMGSSNPRTTPSTYTEPRPYSDMPVFFAACLAFLFSDGNPNGAYEEQRWQSIAETIRFNQGAVTAEQLSPYVSVKEDIEDAVLPVLIRFNGRPEVTLEGNLVYVFPDLRVTASDTSDTPRREHEFLEKLWTIEARYDFSVLRALVWVNLFMCALHFWISHSSAGLGKGTIYHYLLNPYLSNFMLANAIAFIVLPVLTAVYVNMKNWRIEGSNAIRLARFGALIRPSLDLKLKLTEARLYALPEIYVAPEKIIYVTDRDIAEQLYPDGRPVGAITYEQPALERSLRAYPRFKRKQIAELRRQNQFS